MSWRMFAQAILLIAAFFFFYWIVLEIRDHEYRAEPTPELNSAEANMVAAQQRLDRIQNGEDSLLGNETTAASSTGSSEGEQQKRHVQPMDHDEDYSLGNAGNESGR